MFSRRVFLKLSVTSAGTFLIARFGVGPCVRDPAARRQHRPARHPQVRRAARDPAGHAAHRQAAALAGGKNIDYYEIAVRQFQQQILPAGPARDDRLELRLGQRRPARSTTRPSRSRRQWNRPVRVKWINDLVDAQRQLPAAPAAGRPDAALGQPAGRTGRDATRTRWIPSPYTGPVPIVTHVHGAHTTDESDGYAEAWYLPAANNIPAGYATAGTLVRRLQAASSSPSRASTGTPGTRDLPVPQRPARRDALVSRPHARHDPAERLRRAGRLLPAPRRPGDAVDRHAARARRRRSAIRRARATTRSRSPSRTARSTPTARSSTRTAARSSTASPGPTSPTTATSRRSGTRSSSATRWWSTAAPGRSSRSSRAATASAS